MATSLDFGEKIIYGLLCSVVPLSLILIMVLLLCLFVGGVFFFGGFKIIHSCHIRVPANTYWELIFWEVSVFVLLKNLVAEAKDGKKMFKNT